MITHLCFHGIGECLREREPGEATYWVSEDVFLGILDEVHGRDDVRLSFDDGNRSDRDIALPALVERDLTAAFFVLAGRLDDPASLNSADIADLLRAGMTLGSHGWRHVPWRHLETAAVQRELVDARRELERVSGARVDQAALPLGLYDRQALRRLRAAGYRTVFTSDRLPARSDAWLQARYSITAADSVRSVRDLLDRRPGFAEAKNAAKSVIKRWR
jgi:Predicted xylanase/chitin deacetylase